MPKLQMRMEIEKSLLHIAQIYLYTIAADILLSEFAFILGRAISWYTLPLSFLVGIVCLVAFYGDDPKRKTIYEIVASVFIFIVIVCFCGIVYDFSHDGNSYHKVAVGLLKNQWNPIKRLPDTFVEILKVNGALVWVECYSKGAWVFAAGIYSITGNIECGKAYTLIGMLCAFFITYYCMKTHKKDTFFSIVFSLVATLNPVALQQFTTFYVDGYLHLMLYILILSLSMLASKRVNRTIHLIFASIVVCSMVICGTIKFTGLLYGGVYCIVYFIYYCYQQIRDKNVQMWMNIKKCFSLFAGLAAVTVLWAGADTYVMNMIRHGSPFFPLFVFGKGSWDIIKANSPFKTVNHVRNLFVSLFSRMDNMIIASGQDPKLKIPFTVDWPYESIFMDVTDTRISGYGVLFSGILLIAIFAVTVKLIKTLMRKGQAANQTKIDFWILLLLTNMGLCFAITESWWARYAPYIYFTVLLGAFFIGDVHLDKKLKRLKICLIYSFFAIFLCNNLLYLNGFPNKIQASDVIRDEMASLRTYQNVEITSHLFAGVYFNFEDQRVKYSINDDLPESGEGADFPYLDIKFRAE